MASNTLVLCVDRASGAMISTMPTCHALFSLSLNFNNLSFAQKGVITVGNRDLDFFKSHH